MSAADGTHKRPRDADPQPSVGDVEDPWSYHKETVPADVPVRLLPQLVQLANSDEPKDQLQGTLLIRKLLCVEDAPLDQVMESQVVPRLISFLLRDDLVDLQLEVMWAVTNLCSGTSAHTDYVLQQGAVPHFIRLLTSSSEELRKQATWALGNIAGDSTTSRDHILGHGVMAPLLECITTPADDIQVLRNGVWVVSNLCRSKPCPDLDTVCQALPVLVPLLAHADEEVVADACWALAYISDGAPSRVERVLNTGVLPQIITLLTSDHASHHAPATRVVANIAAGNDEQMQSLISGNVLPSFHAVLEREGTKKTACWALSSITAGTPEQIQAVIDAQLFPIILQCLGARNLEIQQEAAWCVSNLADSGSAEQIRYVVEELNVFKDVALVLALRVPKIVTVALAAVTRFLEAGEDEQQRRGLAKNPYVALFIKHDGVSLTENLGRHSNNDISYAASGIADTFLEPANDETDPS